METGTGDPGSSAMFFQNHALHIGGRGGRSGWSRGALVLGPSLCGAGLGVANTELATPL